ncbi:MAG: 4-alpha-glucanotransferase, partial [Candidatus Competibacterales bacterium]|nr:4-alpha-glucanotransferase [Candidatus Competibacterales bacterium]
LPVPQESEHHTADGHDYRRWHWHLPVELPCGYHRLRLAGDTLSLIVVPRRCHIPAAVAEGRCWGLAVQLYALRSARNWGIGDFADLHELVGQAAAAGAATIGLNPLHALFGAEPERASPYSPSSRLWLNPLYLAPDRLPEYAECTTLRQEVESAGFQQRLEALRTTAMVDYAGVAAVKLPVLKRLYDHFRSHHQDSDYARDFKAFRDHHGEALRRDALFETLHEWFRTLDPAVHGWHDWLPGYRHPQAGQVARFAAEHETEVGFHEYLQWQADRQLRAVTEHAGRCGLELGLYQDLAVGVDSTGAETWSEPSSYAVGARIGCPPDDFSPTGQDWGLPPPNPERLHESAYAPFVATLRANLRHAGVLRIDHAMALQRLFWIPPGSTPLVGAYVGYPLDDLIGILALESQRNRCLIVGEALGTVTDEIRTALAEASVFSYRVMYFERDWDGDGHFLRPEEYPSDSLVTGATHDLPTLAGFWAERDIDWRERLDLFAHPEQAAEQRAGRAEDRQRLLETLRRCGLCPADAHPEGPFTPDLALALQRYLARSAARLMMVQAEDVFGQIEQVNLPGTIDAHPNWRRKLTVSLEDWPQDPQWQALAAALREAGRVV